MKRLFLLFVLLLGAAVAWLATSPRRALDELRAAADAGDAARLDRAIDFEAVRANLRTDLRTAMNMRAGSAGTEPLAGLGQAVGGAMVDGLVEGLVTPATIAAFARGRDPGRGSAATDDESDAHIDRRGVNRFVARFSEPGEAGLAPELEFTREGLRWRLTRIALRGAAADAP